MKAPMTMTLVAALSVGLWAAEAETPSVEEIVQRTNYASYYRGADGRARVHMTITDETGRERTREFTILRRDDQPEAARDPEFTGRQRFYVYFRHPADVDKMVFMVHKHLDRDDDRWLYLPDLDLVKRIGATDKRTSFVGSHFVYEDVSGRSVDLDTHELEGASGPYYVLKNTPKDPEVVDFAWYRMYIHKDTFIPVLTEYYDANGAKYRVYQVRKVEDVQGFKTVTESLMKDLRGGGQTLLRYEKVEYNVGVPEDIFTERYLRNPPQDLIQ